MLLAGLALVVVTGTVLSLRNSLWFDEACTIFTTSGTLPDAFRRALRFEQQPPVYFLLAWTWRALHPSVEFLRLFSVACAGLTVWVLHGLSTELRIGGRWWSLGLLAALTPAVLWSGSEARVYALALLLVSATTARFARLLDPEREPGLGDSLWYLGLAYAGLLTFYYTGFVVAGQALAALLSPRRRRLLPLYLVLGLLLLPWAPVVLGQFRDRQAYLPPLAWATAPFGAGWLLDGVRWGAHTVAQAVFRAAPLMGGMRGLGAVAAMLGVVTLARLLPGARRPTPFEGLLVLACVTPVLILLGLRVSNLTLVEDRHWIVVVPGLVLLLGLALGSVAPGWPRRLAVAAVLGVLAAGAGSYLRNYRGQGDWKFVAQYLDRRLAANEPLLFYATDGALPLAYYLPPSNPVFQVPEPDKRQSYATIRLTQADEARAREALADAREAGALWILEKVSLPADSALTMLRRFTSDSLRVTDSVSLVRTRIRKVELRPRAQASR